MITNSNVKSTAMIAYLVFVARSDARASSIKLPPSYFIRACLSFVYIYVVLGPQKFRIQLFSLRYNFSPASSNTPVLGISDGF